MMNRRFFAWLCLSFFLWLSVIGCAAPGGDFGSSPENENGNGNGNGNGGNGY